MTGSIERLHLGGIEAAQHDDYVEAARLLGEALALDDGGPPSLHHDYANVLAHLNRLPEAVQHYQQALSYAPQYAPLHTDLGVAWFRLGQLNLALQCYDTALYLDRNQMLAEVGRGNILRNLNRYDEALAAYDRAIAINENYGDAWRGRGIVMLRVGRCTEALDAFERAITLDPDLPEIVGWHYLAKISLCDWHNITEARSRISMLAIQGKLSTAPFPSLLMPITATQQRDCIKTWAEKFPAPVPLWKGEQYYHDKIRIGYMSSDFRDHAIGHLIAPVIEHHDRSRFEVHGISLANEPVESIMSYRIRTAFDHFLDASRWPDRKIAEEIKDREIDILIDLNGFTEGMRAFVMASRPAPVQVNFLGFSGSMSIPYIDRIIADGTVIPPERIGSYSEKVVWMPNSMMPYDPQRNISKPGSRASCGLPENGLVLCAFGKPSKITPEFFDIWLRLLKTNAGSVLWLSEQHPAVVTNLHDEATLHGVDPDRLIFAPRIAFPADHLGRLSSADLFLDTLPYNAHATAVDALIAGVPVLTCLGDTFAGRVAGGLLRAIGLPELVTNSVEEYGTFASVLCQHRDLLRNIRTTLRLHNQIPVLDIKRYTKELENVYLTMAQ
jgi:protein O-GlcNAc transferase